MLRKGQAAGLVGIITLIIIFYIIFLPPGEREKILAPEKFVESNVSKKSVLLDEQVGFLSPLAEREREHPVPNVVLEETSAAKVLLEIPPFVVKRGWIGEQKKSVSFPIKDLKAMKNVLFTFSLATYRGLLRVRLNGVDVFEGTLDVPNPPPIALRDDVLKEQNTLDVEAVGVGFWFLPRLFEFRDVKIIADVVRPEKLEATHILPLTKAEKEGVERGTLRFFAICDEKGVGTLVVLLNNKQVLKGTPDCGSINQQELFPEDFAEGKNLLTFSLSQGSVRLEQLVVKTKLKEAKPFLQFFQIDRGVKAGRVKLKVLFTEDRSKKRAEVVLNSQRFVIDQNAAVFEKDVTNALKLGNNFVSLTPITDLNIVSLQVVVE
ncbi:hypothetical protein HY490_02715 [Candidatus Woesearchaeota archaeon]|nr:hypothetical protein [Candidatus Woesearchaeota archaeon]